MKSRILFGLLIILVASACKTRVFVSDISEGKYKIAATEDLTPDSEIETIIAPYKKQLDAEMDVVLNQLDIDLTKGKPESTLTNWMCDLVMEYIDENWPHQVDVFFQNYGGIRIPIVSSGDVTVRRMYEIMPFDNEVIFMKGTGKDFMPFFEKIAKSGGWPVSAQFKMKIGNRANIGSISIQGAPLKMDEEYVIAIPDYIANGGDGCSFFSSMEREEVGVKIRDIMIEQCRKRGKMGRAEHTKLDQRIKK